MVWVLPSSHIAGHGVEIDGIPRTPQAHFLELINLIWDASI